MQQSTLNISAHHPTNNLAGLARQIALPANFSPERFPSFPALERTAVMGFTQPATLAVNVGRDTKVIVARQATYPLWGEALSSAAQAGLYQVTYQLEASQTSQIAKLNEFTPLPAPFDTRVGSSIASVAVPGASGAGAVFNWPIMAEDSGLGQVPWIYLPDGGWRLYFTYTQAGTIVSPQSLKLNYETWVTPGQSLQQTNLAEISVAANVRGGMSVAITATNGGVWVRPISIDGNTADVTPVAFTYLTATVVSGTAVYASSALNGGNIAVTGADCIGMIPLVTPSEFANSQIPWYACRLTAVGALFTNVTQVLNKGGTVMAGRIAPQNNNPWLVSRNHINGLHPAEKAFLPLETGLYTYCPPSTDMTDFHDYVSNTGITGTPVPLYRLDNTALVNVAYFTPGSVAEALAINCSWHIEFRTTSALFQIAMCGLTLETLHQAQLALHAAGFFFENPNHVAILKSVMRAASKYGPAVYNAIRGRAAKPVTPPKRSQSNTKKKMGKTVAVPRGPSVVRATNAKASGIVTARRKGKSGISDMLNMRGAKSVVYSY